MVYDTSIQITPIPAFRDNYIWVLHNLRHAVLVDPGDAKPCIAFMEQHGLTLSAILNTHHHHDHTGGNQELAARYQPSIYGPHQEIIPCLTHPVQDGDRIALPELCLELSVLATPGHTLGHVVYHATNHSTNNCSANLLFCGDTLFSCGCGRLFEGSPANMLSSLERISQLPHNTEIYCAHEYTLSNMSFAKKIEPENAELSKQAQIALAKRQAGLPTLPSTIVMEKAINPFLRCHVPDLIQTVESWLGRPPHDKLEVFTELRKAKDHF